MPTRKANSIYLYMTGNIYDAFTMNVTSETIIFFLRLILRNGSAN